MLTPQEVSNHAFAKAVMGGYNMAMVDEFLDELTDDYTSLYKENAALKAKMKVLVAGQLEQGKPDFVEILPGIMPRVIAEISARTQVPVIAGGLLRDKADVMAAMRAGAAAVSTSAPSLWDI